MSCPSKKRKLEENYATELYPVLSSEFTDPTPLTTVYIDTISDPKNISKVVVQLNSVLPLPQFNHLKRIKGKDVLILPYSEELNPDSVHDKLKSDNFDTSLLENKIRTVLVAEIPPKTKKQHDAVHKLWPCNFHSNKYVEKLTTNTLFSQTEIENHVVFMRMALDVAKYSTGSVKIGVVIVDFKINSVVAVGFDGRTENPCQHAVMIAIDNVAMTQKGGAWNRNADSTNFEANGVPKHIFDELKCGYPKIKFGAAKFKDKNEIEAAGDGPYLCTGYSVYVTREPCVMCCMALIHSRAKRVFYGSKSEKRGGLESMCKIHTVKDLNHHYEVFGGLLKVECDKLEQLTT